jgi:thiol-disulfide isomerase/thioredoxin
MFRRVAAVLIAALLLDAAAQAALEDAAPDFTLKSRAGENIKLSELRGQVVLINFWASWCGPCRQSFPWMNDLQKRYGDKGLAIVAVNLDKDREFANAFLSEVPASITVVFDPAGTTAERYKVKAMPTTVLVSADGHVLVTHTGFDARHAPEFEAQIAEALPR